MEPILATLATTTVIEGVKFLYNQTSEILDAWRKRRRDGTAPPPRLLEAPQMVRVGPAKPLLEAPSQDVEDKLTDLRDLAELIKDGRMDPDSQEARVTVGSLRDLMETILRAPITFAGEPPRTLRVADVDIVVQTVSGQIAGVRASLEKLKGPTEIRDVKVKAGDVQAGGDVKGVDLV